MSMLALVGRASIAALLLCAAPAQAGPRVTLKLENATLHEAFRQLSRQTGLQFRSQDGAGDEDYKDPVGAKRSRFDWKNAPLGAVIRELCGAYGVSASAMGDNGFWFQPGPLPKRREVVKDGIAFSIPSISQSESLLLIPGQPKPRVTRGLSIRLAARAEDGDGDVIGPISRLTVTDAGGRTIDATASGTSESGYGLPDERYRSIYIPWPAEHAPRLQRIEGEMTLYSQVQEQRFAFPVPLKGGPEEQQSGPVKVKVTKLTHTDRQFSSSFRLTWGKETEVAVFGNGSVRLLAKFEDGRTERIYPQVNQGELGGERYAQFELNVSYGKAPALLEVLVPTRTSTGKKIAFRIDDVLLPFGKPLKPRTQPLGMKPRDARGFPRLANRFLPRSFYDSEGGTLLVPPPGAPDPERTTQAVVGISRRNGDGSWTATRWVQVDLGDDAARLPYLSPGTYRLRLQYWQRGDEGTSPRRLPLPERSATVQIQAGKEIAL